MIRMKSVKKGFGSGKDYTSVLNHITIDIQEGQYVAITGPSGSGKSTLLNLIGGLEPIDEGEIFVDRDPIHLLKDHELAELRSYKIGYVFQQFLLLPTATALENVMMPLLTSTSSKDAEQRAREALEKVGLSHRMNHLPSKLSGGEQQRVAIARAMIINPRLILADEPTGNLDSETGLTIIQLLEQFHRENNTTIVIITHDRKLAERAGAIIHLLDGKVSRVES